MTKQILTEDEMQAVNEACVELTSEETDYFTEWAKTVAVNTALMNLVDLGLIKVSRIDVEDGEPLFSLTEAGQQYANEHPEIQMMSNMDKTRHWGVEMQLNVNTKSGNTQTSDGKSNSVQIQINVNPYLIAVICVVVFVLSLLQ